MGMHSTKYYLLTAFLCLYILGLSQDFESDFNAIANKVNTSENLYLKAKAKVFNHNNELEHEVTTIKSKSGKSVYLNLGDLEIVTDGDKALTVDRQEKEIHVSKVSSNAGKKYGKVKIDDEIKAMLNNGNNYKAVLLSSDSKNKVYRITGVEKGIDSLLISMDLGSLKLKKIEIYYNDQSIYDYSHMSIEYIVFSYGKPEGFITVRSILSTSNELTSDYKKFNLILSH